MPIGPRASAPTTKAAPWLRPGRNWPGASTLMIREGSTAKNLTELLPAVTPASQRRTMLVTDDCHPEDLWRQGHVDHLLKRAMALGCPPLTALTMTTLNPAEYFRLPDRGAVAPGYQADLVVVNNLEEFRVEKVLKQGRLVAADGRLTEISKLHRAAIPAGRHAGSKFFPRLSGHPGSRGSC